MFVGNAALDAQHIALLEFSRSLDEGQAWLTEEPFRNRLEDLVQLAQHHCCIEEEVLARHGSDWIDQHRAEHEAGLHRLQQLLKRYCQGALPRKVVCGAVCRWCVSHIVDMDPVARDCLPERVGSTVPGPLPRVSEADRCRPAGAAVGVTGDFSDSSSNDGESTVPGEWKHATTPR